MSTRRILFVSEFPLADSVRSFLARSSIEITRAIALDPAVVASFDLLVLDEKWLEATGLAEATTPLIVLSRRVPEPAELDSVEAFLIEPFNQGDVIGAIGDALGTELRRAMRLAVELPTTLTRARDKTSDATVLQLSETGCLFEVNSSIPVGEAVSISFVLPSNRERLELKGTIVSKNELQLLYGLCFDQGFESERLAILVFVELGLAAAEREGAPPA